MVVYLYMWSCYWLGNCPWCYLHSCLMTYGIGSSLPETLKGMKMDHLQYAYTGGPHFYSDKDAILLMLISGLVLRSHLLNVPKMQNTFSILQLSLTFHIFKYCYQWWQLNSITFTLFYLLILCRFFSWCAFKVWLERGHSSVPADAEASQNARGDFTCFISHWHCYPRLIFMPTPVCLPLTFYFSSGLPVASPILSAPACLRSMGWLTWVNLNGQSVCVKKFRHWCLCLCVSLCVGLKLIVAGQEAGRQACGGAQGAGQCWLSNTLHRHTHTHREAGRTIVEGNCKPGNLIPPPNHWI